jgi:hypothetical protein
MTAPSDPPFADPAATGEWAEGLREAILKALEPYDIPFDSFTEAERLEPVNAVLAVVEPRVISLAGEVQRLTTVLQGIATYDGRAGLGYEAPASFAAAALSPHPSEPEDQ